jgi:glycosyltransferase involved in cell wall biosynthesis
VQKTRISAIVPAFNEEDSIAATLQSIHGTGLVDEILVVDDGSQDATAAIAQRLGARVIRHRANCGKAGALRTGIVRSYGDILVFLDADLKESASELKKLVLPVIEDQADMTIAKFPPLPGKTGWGLVKGLARRGVQFYTRQRVDSPLSGQRAMRKAIFHRVDSLGYGYGVEVALTIDVLQAGYRVLEVPVNMRHRVTRGDLAGYLHRGREFVDIAWTLLVRAWEKKGRMQP